MSLFQTYFVAISSSLAVLAISAYSDEIKEKAQRGSILSSEGEIIVHSENGKRTYLYGKEMSHVTGYVNTRKNKAGGKNIAGALGIEKKLDTILKQGKDVNLTIDTQTQLQAYALLEEKGLEGAIVVQDTSTGKILALASYPSYDANLFIPSINQANFNMLVNDVGKPLVNRAIWSHNMGFIAVPLTALSAESKGIKNPTLLCKAKLKVAGITFKDHNANRNENLDVSSAMQTGCGVYFMQLALKTGLGDMSEMANEMGFREKVDPANNKADKLDTFWKETDSKPMLAMYGTGHGVSLASPLQVNRFTSAIASGILIEPIIVKGELSDEKTLVGIGKISEQSLTTIRIGMVKAFNHNNIKTKAAEIRNLKIAGLTSTVQSGPRSSGAWFTGYAPHDKPKFTVTVYLEAKKEKNISGKKDAQIMAIEMFEILQLQE